MNNIMTISRRDIDFARIEAELDDPITPLLMAKADWYEAAGQQAMAGAYRRIIREGKVPSLVHNGWRWSATDVFDRFRHNLPVRTHAAARVHSLCAFRDRPDFPRDVSHADLDTFPLSLAFHGLAMVYAEEAKQ